MIDTTPAGGIPPDALFVIACPTCLGHVSARAGMARRPACCPLCAATFQVPEPRLPVNSTPGVAEPAVAAEPAPVAPAGSGSPPMAVVEPEPAPPAPATATPAAAGPDPDLRPGPDEEPAAAPSAGPHPESPAVTATAQPHSWPEPQAATATADAAAADFHFRDPVKTVGRGPATIELRRLTDEERRIRRARRSVLFLLVGAAILIALALALGTPPRR